MADPTTNPWENNAWDRNTWSPDCDSSTLIYTGPPNFSPTDEVFRGTNSWDGLDPGAVTLLRGSPPRLPRSDERQFGNGMAKIEGSCFFITSSQLTESYNCHGYTRAMARVEHNARTGETIPLELRVIDYPELEEGLSALGYKYMAANIVPDTGQIAILDNNSSKHSAWRAAWTTNTGAVFWESKLGSGFDRPLNDRILHALNAIEGRSYGSIVGYFTR